MQKKKWLIIALILIILLLLLVVFYLLFGVNRSFTISFDSNGGTEIANIEVKDGKIAKLPDNPKRDGYKFVAWTNKEGNVVTNGTKVTKDLELKAEWIKIDAKVVTIQFNADDGNGTSDIILEEGKELLFPVNPVKEGYIFVGWVLEDGRLVTEDTKITSNVTLKALWIKKGAKTNTIKFNTDGGSNISGIIVENGKLIVLPVNPKKDGYVFTGWVDEKGNSITSNTVVTSNMSIKALWKEPYTCPSGCTPIGDGSKCTREKTTAMVTKTSCPSGSTLYTPWYNKNKSLCIKLSTKVDANIRQCDTWEDAEVDYKDSNGKSWCVKTVKKISSKGCPSGYTQSGTICKKTETVKCTAN